MAILDAFIFSLKDGRQVFFRNLTPKDAENFLSFNMQVAQESTHTLRHAGMSVPSAEEMKKRLQFQQDDKLILNIGVFDAEKVIGYLNFRVMNPDHPWVRHIGQFGMMILKEYWGQGIGQRLLQLQEAHAKSQGVSRIESMVRVKNDRGIKLYEKCGYEIEGTRRQAARINGEIHDEYFIAKIL